MVQSISRHPLTSFVPQFGLVSIAGVVLTGEAGLDFSIFIQTAIFVIFNKVCTSQVSLTLLSSVFLPTCFFLVA